MTNEFKQTLISELVNCYHFDCLEEDTPFGAFMRCPFYNDDPNKCKCDHRKYFEMLLDQELNK